MRRKTFGLLTGGGLVIAALVVAAGGGVFAADFQYPLAVVVDAQENIFVADRDLPGVWKIVDGKQAVYFQGSKKFGTPLNAVRCLALDQQGKLLAGDSATREVYRFDDKGQPQPLSAGGIGIPIAIAVNRAGDIFVADLELHRICKLPSAGGQLVEFAKVVAPRGMTIDGEDRLWIVSHDKDLLIRLDAAGKAEVVVKGQPLKSPSFPAGIVLGKDNTAFLADGYQHAIWQIPPGGEPKILAKEKPLVHPVGIAWRGTSLLAADPRAGGLVAVDLAGKAVNFELKTKAP